MAKSIGLLVVHGMGDTRPDFHKELTEPLQSRLGGRWDQIACRSVFYQRELQGNQEAIFRKMRDQLRWDGLRELMLYGFADAGSLEHKKERPGSPYARTQRLILDALDEMFSELGGVAAPVAIAAHSLGGHVMSNYIWDAQQAEPFAGVWKRGETPPAANDAHEQFRRLRTLQRFLTTGCNIPVFVAGHDVIEPIDRALLGPGFRWVNQFDPDDALGWPLRQLSAGYEELVEDVSVNAAGRTLWQVIKSFGPYGHTQYWSTRRVLDRIAAELRAMLDAPRAIAG